VLPYCWQFKGERVEILPQRGKNINTLGFMNSCGDAVKMYAKQGSVNAQFVIDSIDNWSKSLTKASVLVLDNARIHHAKIFEARVEDWEKQGLYIFFLPPYSPHLNKIETLWRVCKYRWIKPQDYENLETLQTALDNIWKNFGKKYKINFKQPKI
jgi:transposase